MSLYRSGPGDQATQQGLDTLDRLRNSVVDSVDLGGWHLDGARRMSITNAIDILRRHVMKAIKRKKDRHLVNMTSLSPKPEVKSLSPECESKLPYI